MVINPINCIPWDWSNLSKFRKNKLFPSEFCKLKPCLLCSPEILISTYFPEIALYFNLYSQNLITGISIESEYFYPNPFGGEAFPIIGEIKIDSQTKKLLIIKNIEQAKQEEVNRIIKDMLEEMSKQGDSPIKKEEMPNFTVNSESYYYYDIKKKIINKVRLEKKIEISGITQTEILEVNLIK